VVFLSDMKGSALFWITQNFLPWQMKPFGNVAFMRNLLQLFSLRNASLRRNWTARSLVGRPDLQKGLEDHKEVERPLALLPRQAKGAERVYGPICGRKVASLPVQRSSAESFLGRVDPKLIAGRYVGNLMTAFIFYGTIWSH